MTQSLKDKINLFVKNGELHLDLPELLELRKFCRDTFRFSVDINCSGCVARHARKVHEYFKKND